MRARYQVFDASLRIAQTALVEHAESLVTFSLLVHTSSLHLVNPVAFMHLLTVVFAVSLTTVQKQPSGQPGPSHPAMGMHSSPGSVGTGGGSGGGNAHSPSSPQMALIQQQR